MKSPTTSRRIESIGLTLIVVVAAACGVAAGQGFHEGWEIAPPGDYTPGDFPVPVDEAFIHGDEGWWNYNNSIGDDPNCVALFNYAKIRAYGGSQVLVLLSGPSTGYCSNNIWVALRDFGSGYNTDFAIPLTPDTMISFEEDGELFDPSPDFAGWWPPFFTNVSLQLADNRDNLLIYVLQRHRDAERDDDAPYYGESFTEVFLNRFGGTFTRNLYDDFSRMSDFNPIGAQIEYIEFKVDELGWALLDNLKIAPSDGDGHGGGGWPAMDIDWIVMTSAKEFLNGVPDNATPWFFEVWVSFAEPGAVHRVDVTKPSESVPFATLYDEGDADWSYEGPDTYASLAELQADYPPGTYTFEFRTYSNLLLRTVYLDYSGLAGEPANPASFTFPSIDGQTDVPVNPTLTWTVAGSDGDALMLELEDLTDEYDVAFEAPVSMGTTSWAVGPLEGSHEHNASVSVCRVKDWVGPDWPEMTVDSDSFHYALMIEYLNDISFWTGSQAAVYRFWSPDNGRHFFTTNRQEKDFIQVAYSSGVWTYEGVAYYAFSTNSEAGLAPVYRFWSPLHNSHFFTISEDEKEGIIETYPESTWTYEGVAFYAYPEDSPPGGTSPVHRFWSPLHAAHFFTISEAEKDSIIETYPPAVWTYEGIAWYAYD